MIVKAAMEPLVRCGCVRLMNAPSERFSKKCPVAGATIMDVTKPGQPVTQSPTDNIFAIMTKRNGAVHPLLIRIAKRDLAMTPYVMDLTIRQPNMF